MIVTSQIQERLNIPQALHINSRMIRSDDWVYFRGDEIALIEYVPHGLSDTYVIPEQFEVLLVKLRTFKPCMYMHYSHNDELDKLSLDYDKRRVLNKIKEGKSSYYVPRCTLNFFDISIMVNKQETFWWQPFNGLYSESRSRITFHHPGNHGFILDDYHV